MSEKTRKKELAESEAAALALGLEAQAAQVQNHPIQKGKWRNRADNRVVEKTPPHCQACLAEIRREIEVTDEARGWWVYRDPDALDDEAGSLELTPRFYHDLASTCPSRDSGSPPTSKPRKISLASPQKTLRAGIGLTSYDLSFTYSPLVVQSPRAQISLDLTSNLSLNRLDSTLTGNLSAGVEVRW